MLHILCWSTLCKLHFDAKSKDWSAACICVQYLKQEKIKFHNFFFFFFYCFTLSHKGKVHVKGKGRLEVKATQEDYLT